MEEQSVETFFYRIAPGFTGVGNSLKPAASLGSTLDKGPFCVPNLPEAFTG